MNKRTLSPRTPSRSSETAKGLDPPNSLNQRETSNLQGSAKSNQTASQSSSSNSQKSTSTPTCADENLLGGNNINPRKISDNLSHQNDEQTTTQLNELETAEINPRKKTPPSKNSPKKSSDTLSRQKHEQPITTHNEVETAEINPRKKTPPSKKNRRLKGEGSGSIYYRTVTKHGKEYQEAYYHWCENGKKRTKYIPKKLLNQVKEAEYLKLPVSDIVILLGGNNINPRKISDTLSRQNDEQLTTTINGVVTSEINPRKKSPPSKKRRKQGYGAGYIECKPIKRNGKEYKQYWYHYEFWDKGDRIVKKCRYIQEHLLTRVQKLEAEKAPVRKILKLLGVR